MIRKPVFLVAVGVILVAGIVFAVTRRGARSPSNIGSLGQAAGLAEDRPESELTEGSGDLIVARLTTESIERAADRVADLVASEHRSDIRNAVADTLTTYTSGSFSDWVAYLDSYGIIIPEIAFSSPEVGKMVWGMTRRFMDSAEFDVDKIKVMKSFDNPPPEGDDGRGGVHGPGYVIVESRRDAGRPFLRSVPERTRRTIRVSIPGRFNGLSGSQFDAEFRMEYSYDPISKLWVLTELGMRGGAEAQIPGFAL